MSRRALLAVTLCLVIGAYETSACGPPTKNSNSWYSPQRYHFHYDQRVTYHCEEGFEAIGGSRTRTCLTSYTWSGSPLICARQRRSACIRPADPAHGRVLSYPEVKRSFRNRQFVHYRCNQGYEMDGAERVQCLNGRWSHVPRCNKIPSVSCSHRSPPINGNYAAFQQTKKKWHVGEVAIFACHRRFVLNGKIFSICLKNGQWSSSIPSCKVDPSQVICPHRAAPSNGQYVTNQARKTSWRINDVALYLCHNGYVMRGNRSSRCLLNGKWSAEVPRCRVTCPNRAAPIHGIYFGRYKSTWFAYDVANFNCNHGYAIVGQGRSICQSSGSWSSSVPRCKRFCLHREPPRHGEYANKQAGNSTWFESDEARYVCDNGYVMSGSRKSVCLSSGKWSSVVPRCQRLTCSHRSGPQHGGYASYQKSKTTWYPEETAMYKCNQNYAMSGSRQSVCLSSGSWSTGVPTCRRTCPRRSQPRNGAYFGRYKTIWIVGDVARFSCRNGYIMSGARHSVCQSNGAWSSPQPKCRRICPERGPPQNGTYVKKNVTTWAENDVARYRCKPGFVISGQPFSVCQSTGLWSSSLPSCRRVCPHRLPPQSGRYTRLQRSKRVWFVNEQASFICDDGFVSRNLRSRCLSNGQWSSAVPLCRRIVCPHRPSPQHGGYATNQKNKTTWYVRELATFVCRSGYVMSGSFTSTCLVSGSWSSPVPRCRLVCRHRAAPRNGGYSTFVQQNKTWYVNDQATFTCNDGYVISGNRISVCLPSGSWSNNIPRCRKTCPRRAAPQNGNYVGRNRRVWVVGDSVRFTCRNGYILSKTEPSICQSTGIWSSSVPSCRRVCPHRLPPQSGRYTRLQRSKRVWFVNEQASFICDDGFVSRNLRSTCLSNGRWSSDVPLCRRIICPHRPSPQNGDYINNQSNKTIWYVRETARFTCRESYVISGSASSSCLVNGNWSSPVPQCRLICQHRLAPENGQYLISQVRKTIWYVNEEAIYNCNNGYLLSGNQVSRCLPNGKWSNQIPNCRRLCSNRPAPQNGAYIGGNRRSWVVNDLARFSCNDGFVLSGATTSLCQSNGRWSASVPRCIRICSIRPAPKNGRYANRFKRTWFVRDVARFLCNDGYFLTGVDLSICQSSGTWSSSVPMCQRVCPHRLPPQSGRYTRLQRSKRVWFVNEQASFICDDGFVSRNLRSTCLSNGRWSSDVPLCRRIICPHRPSPQNGDYINNQSNKTIWYVRETARFTCRESYVISGSASSSCLVNGNWSSPVPQCRLTCLHRPAPVNGRYTITKTIWYVDEEASYNCSEGYILNGDRNSRCLPNGEWNTLVPTCDRLCPSRPAPQNGAYIGGNRRYWVVDDLAQFSCNDGFVLSGATTSFCQSTGRWSASAPTCRRICSIRPAPKNGRYANRFKRTWFVRDVARFLCNDGYFLTGVDLSICQSSGTWSSSVPMCQRVCPHRLPPQSGRYTRLQRSKRVWFVNEQASFICDDGFVSRNLRSTCLSNGQWSSDVPLCRRIICPHRPSPQNGDYINNQSNKTIWYVRETARFTCRESYVISGSASSSCLVNGNWSSPVPQCRLTCLHRPAPVNGRYTITKTIWYVDEEASYNCSEGYILNGDRNSRCLPNGEWNTLVPTCDRLCPSRPAPQNGAYIGGNRRFWVVDDLAQFSCNDGFVLSGATTSLCQSTGRWSASAPTCRRICSIRPAPKNGRYANRFKRTWFVRDVARFLCNDGYFLTGVDLSICQSSGTWSSSVPMCQRVCPHRLPPQSGRYTRLQRSKRVWFVNEQASFICDDGFVSRNLRSTCLSNGQWSSDVPLCRRIICPHRPSPQNGDYINNQSNKTIWYVRETARFTCRESYVISGSASSSCLVNGNWSSPVPQCRLTCLHRPAPVNGRYTITKTIWYVDEEASYNCSEGYILNGDRNSRCLPNGEWNTLVPTCDRLCPSRPAPQNGAYIGGNRRFWVVDDQATFLCNDGFVLSGATTSLCQSTGRWSSSAPTCRRVCVNRPAPQNGAYIGIAKTTWFIGDIARFTCDNGYDLSGEDTSSCQLTGTWSSNVPSCTLRVCPHRPPPEFGGYTRRQRSKTIWAVNDEAVFICDSGFQLSGRQKSRCLRSGSWSSDPPNCRRTCFHRLSPQNGNYVSSQRSKTVWFVGDVASFTCNGSYVLSGSASSKCLPSGLWSSDIPFCEGTCPSRMPPTNGAYFGDYLRVWRVGDNARFACNSGYTLTGNEISTCLSSGDWSSIVPSCQLRNCPHRSAPRNGRYVFNQRNKTTWLVQESAAFRCNVNYVISGASRSVCLASGNWSTDVPTCREQMNVRCTHRHSPRNGRYVNSQVHKTSWQPGDIARYQCDYGFTMIGHKRSRCSDAGSWSSPVPSCQHTCPHLQPPVHGAFIPSQARKTRWLPGDTATFRCYPGYSINKNSIYCLQGGRWSSGVPSCTPNPTCKLPRSPQNGRIRANPAGKQTFRNGESITFECNENYELVGSSKAKCVGKTWKNIPRCQLKVTCRHREAPANGYFLLGRNKTIWYSGDSARFACNDGYRMFGSNHVTCQTNAQWSASVPSCLAIITPTPSLNGQANSHSHSSVTCPHRPAPVNGIYIQDVGKTVWHPGDIARYRCNPNFILIGHDYTDCRFDGTWRFSVPTCQGNANTMCERPPNPSHGSIHSNPKQKTRFESGEYVIYRCHTGYHMNGQSKALCMNGVWKNTPTCTFTTTCPHRAQPRNGGYIRNQNRLHWFVGDVAQYRCNQGFTLIGHSFIDCQADGTWRFPVPTCQSSQSYHGNTFSSHVVQPTYAPQKRVKCPKRPAPRNGKYITSQNQWMSGDVVQFSCSEGFELVGHAQSTCQMDGTWQNEVPTCRRRIETVGSCRGQCDAFDVGGCTCDPECARYFDCCSDFETFCAANSTTSSPFQIIIDEE